MAVDRAFLRRLRIFAADVETTTGTAMALDTASDHAALNVFAREFEPDMAMDEREMQNFMSMLKASPGARMGRMPITTEVVGNGASGLPLWGTLLLASAGMTASGSTYTVDSTHTTTITAGLNVEGNLFVLAGCKSNAVFNFRSGHKVDVDFNIMGKYMEPFADTALAPTFPTTMPPRFASATLTVGGTGYKVSQCSLDLGNELVMREDATADDDTNRSGDGTGYHACEIVNRRPVFTMDPEDIAFGTKNWYQDLMDADQLALSIVLGADANNIITFTAPKLQLLNASPGDRNGLAVNNLEFLCTYNGSGDDELTIAFS